MRAAMVNPLLERAPPKVFAERGQVIENHEKLDLFPRLTEAVGADLARLSDARAADAWRQRPVAFRLAFGFADTEHGLPALEGRAEVEIPAVCQRCLEVFELSLGRDFRLLFSGPGGRADTSLDYEVWELEEGLVRPLDVLDEALVMALPFAARHASDTECGPLASEAPAASDGGETVRPFADLRAQMRDGKRRGGRRGKTR